MTILKPHRNLNFKNLLLPLFFALFIGGLAYIFEYNAFVNARYELNNLKKEVVKLETANADLKNNRYKVIDLANLQAAAQGENLTLEQRPEYLRENQWLSDSSH